MFSTLILIGGITTHPFNPDSRGLRTIAPMGTIVNPYSIVTLGSDTFKGGLILGKDSMRKSIAGPIFSYKVHSNISIIGGTYQDNGHNKATYSMSGKKYVPVVGVDFHFKLYETQNFAVESHNLISIITTHSIGVSFNF